MDNRFCEEAQGLVLKGLQIENPGKFLQMAQQIKLGNRTAAFQARSTVERAFQANIEGAVGRRIIGKDACFFISCQIQAVQVKTRLFRFRSGENIRVKVKFVIILPVPGGKIRMSDMIRGGSPVGIHQSVQDKHTAGIQEREPVQVPLVAIKIMQRGVHPNEFHTIFLRKMPANFSSAFKQFPVSPVGTAIVVK